VDHIAPPIDVKEYRTETFVQRGEVEHGSSVEGGIDALKHVAFREAREMVESGEWLAFGPMSVDVERGLAGIDLACRFDVVVAKDNPPLGSEDDRRLLTEWLRDGKRRPEPFKLLEPRHTELRPVGIPRVAPEPAPEPAPPKPDVSTIARESGKAAGLSLHEIEQWEGALLEAFAAGELWVLERAEAYLKADTPSRRASLHPGTTMLQWEQRRPKRRTWSSETVGSPTVKGWRRDG
jgi:hypothetical protein